MSPERLIRVLESHWLNPHLLRNDQFAECFVGRGEAMLELIGRAMGKPTSSGRDIFWDALNAAGFVEELAEFDEPDEEYDDVGEVAYDGDVSSAAD